MLLEQVMPAFREGKKIRRAKWPSYAYMVNDYKEGKFFIRHDDRLSDQEKFSKVCGGLHATDWELFGQPTEVVETPPVRKRVRA